MKFKVYEMEVKVYLLSGINASESNIFITELIDSVLTKDDDFLKMHVTNSFKPYVFNNFYPMESDYMFKEGNIYTFRLRAIDEKLVNYLKENIRNAYTNTIKVLTVLSKVIPPKHIEKIFSITPIIMKFEDGYWRTSHNINDVEDRIIGNLKKKYKQFFGEEVPNNIEIFNCMKFKNKKPLPTKYKNIQLLGDKIEFKVANNRVAQELAYLSLGVGVGELNARSFGFMNYIWIPKEN